MSSELFVAVICPSGGRTYLDNHRYFLYAKSAVSDSLKKGESPFSSFLLYDQVLESGMKPAYSKLANATANVHRRVDKLVVYNDYGITDVMQCHIDSARKYGIQIEERSIGKIEHQYSILDEKPVYRDLL